MNYPSRSEQNVGYFTARDTLSLAARVAVVFDREGIVRNMIEGIIYTDECHALFYPPNSATERGMNWRHHLKIGANKSNLAIDSWDQVRARKLINAGSSCNATTGISECSR